MLSFIAARLNKFAPTALFSLISKKAADIEKLEHTNSMKVTPVKLFVTVRMTPAV